jgi:hypothetical protein
VIETLSVTSKGTTGCARTQALLADIALARDYSSLSTSQQLLAGYAVDTFGNTFQYVSSASDPTKSLLASLYSLGCDQPLYFAPAVVQLDRAPQADTSSKHFIYLVQATNSNLDPDTMQSSAASEIVVTKLDGNVSPPVIVTSYNPLDQSGRGQIVLTSDAHPVGGVAPICLQTVNSTTGSLDSFTNTTTKNPQTCADIGGTPMPSTARPVATPTVILRSDGLGFQVVTSWYDPVMTNNCSGSSQFNYGKSYVTVHEFGADGAWYQIAGITLNNTVLTGIAFVGTGLFVDGINAGATPQGINIGETFTFTQQILNNAGPDRYSRTSWTERLDL